MIAEDLMRKYKYGYVHSCKLLEEPFIKTLLKENQLLKKQLEEANKKLYLCTPEIPQNIHEKYVSYVDLVNEMYELKKQQQEFINYLEDEIQSCEAVSDLLFNFNKEMKVYKEILQKYKEIVGISNERKS